VKRPVVVFIAIVVVVIVVGPMLANNSRIGIRPTPHEGVKESRQDPELATAVIRAKKELPRFIKMLKDRPDGEFAINARVDTPKGPEQIWVKVNIFRDGVFYGEIASDPVALDKANGDGIDVPESDVSDWTYRVDGKTEGGFTMEVLKNR